MKDGEGPEEKIRKKMNVGEIIFLPQCRARAAPLWGLYVVALLIKK